jgi:hypothetical protein
MRYLFFLLFLLFGKSALGQALPNLQQLAKELSYTITYGECKISVVTDSIIELAFSKKIKVGSTQLRGIQDSLDYKLFFIFRKEKDRQEYYNRIMKKLSTQVDSIINNDRYKSFDFSKYYQEKYIDLFSITIPPTIINEKYSVVVIDNTIYPSNYVVKEDFFLWYSDILSYLFVLADGNKLCYYKPSLSMYMQIEMFGNFGLFNWRRIKEINYPHLFKK